MWSIRLITCLDYFAILKIDICKINFFLNYFNNIYSIYNTR